MSLAVFSKMFSRAYNFAYFGKSFCSSVSVNKSSLSKLRKATGYTFANCKKALQENNNDVKQAEKWLREQAQQLGWAKATKLEGRPTAHGLVAVCIDRNTGIMVEVNCETDFVARNKNFHSLVETVTNTCLYSLSKKDLVAPFTKFRLDQGELKSLMCNDGKLLADHVAMAIGQLGENLSMRRATCLRASEGVVLVGHAHPAEPPQASVLWGKYAALLALREDTQQQQQQQQHALSLEQIGKQLCQHVVGMNPSKFGEPGVDEPAADPDDEQCMVYQEYLLDPSVTVGQLLSDNGIAILDFERFECGEALGSSSVEPPVDLQAEVQG